MRKRSPIAVSLAVLSGIVVIGAAGYVAIEGWSPLDAIWMVIITVTTVGFGEVHALSTPGRIFTLLLLVSSLGTTFYFINALTTSVFEGDMTRYLRERRRRKLMSELTNHFIVVGYGRLGRAVVEELTEAGHPVCVVERRPEVVDELEEKGLCPVVPGDGSSDEVLLSAGIQRAHAMAVATPHGAEAVFVTLSARQLNPSLRIVTRAEDADTGHKARRAGASAVVSPLHMGGWRMAHWLTRPTASSFLDLATLAAHDDVLLDEIIVPEGSPMAGHSIGDLRVRARFDVLVVAVREHSGRLIASPHADQLIHSGDVIIIIGHPTNVRRFSAGLAGEQG